MTRLSQQFLKQRVGSDQPSTLLLTSRDQPERTMGFLDPIIPPPTKPSQDMLPRSDSDFSDVKGDLLPDEEEQEASIFEKEDRAHIARLADWLDQQNLADTHVILPEISSSVPEYREPENWLSSAGVDRGIATVRKVRRAPDLTIDARLPLRRTHKSDEEVTVRKNADTHHHRRGFSFIPGDDSEVAQPHRPRTTSVSGKVVNAEGGARSTLPLETSSNAQEGSPTCGNARPVSTQLRSLAGEPQRDNSNRSVLTAIHNGVESPSGPIKASNEGPQKRMRPGRQESDKQLSFATAAARAAGKAKEA